MTEPEVERPHWLLRIALISFVIGLALIAIGFGHVDGAVPWFRTGAVGCLIAYFLVLLDNFKRKLPVQTRGGLVRREDGAVKLDLDKVGAKISGQPTIGDFEPKSISAFQAAREATLQAGVFPQVLGQYIGAVQARAASIRPSV